MAACSGSQLLCQACLVLVHPGQLPGIVCCVGVHPGKTSSLAQLPSCHPKKAVQDKGWSNCITAFENCHLCCFGASKEDNAEKRWIPAEERLWKETKPWGDMCCLPLSAGGMWMSSPSATCANARQICLNCVRRPVNQLQCLAVGHVCASFY